MRDSINRKDIIQNVSIFSTGTYIARIMFFLRGFLNAKILGPSLYGLWSALNIIINYSSYMHLGSLNAMSREIPYQQGRQSQEGIDKTRRAAFAFCLLTNSIFSLILMIIAVVLYKRVSPRVFAGLITMSFLSFIFSIHEFYKTSLVASKKFFFISKINVIFPILSVIFTLIFVPSFKIYGVYIANLLVSSLTLLYIWNKGTFSYRLTLLNLDFKEIFRLIKIGFPLMSINFINDTILSICSIMVLILLGRENLGYYSVAVLSAHFLIYFPERIHDTFEPYIYQRYGETNALSELKKYLFKPTIAMASLFPIILGIYYIAATFFIRNFLPKYSVSIYPFLFILIAVFFTYFSPTVFALIMALNKQRFIVPVYLIAIIIVFMSSLIFINMGYGITGVAVGFLLSSFFSGSVVFIYTINQYIKNAFKCFLYLGCLCLPLLYILAALFFIERLIPNSQDLFLDLLNLGIKLGALSIFSLPLIILANNKTGIIIDILNLLRLDRIAFKKYKLAGRHA